MNPVVAVGAHPDDLEIFCGGTLALLADLGIPVVGIIASRGEKGSRQRGVDPVQLSARRRGETEAAARILGLSELVFLGFPDGELDRFPDELRRKLAEVYRRLHPQAIFAFDPWRPYELHPDHRTIGFAAAEARLAAKLPLYYPEQLAAGLEPWDVVKIYLYHTAQPDTWFGVDQTFDRKLKAIWAHRSQFDEQERCEMEEALRAEARRYGPRAGAEHAEGFKCLAYGRLQILDSLARWNGEG